MRRDLRVYDSVAEAVGWTPMVRLSRCTSGLGREVFAKLEMMNPTGSIKDRLARHLVQKALADGRLEPGGTVVEASSGNTAAGLAMMAILEDLECRMVVRSQTSREKLDLLSALGVELELVDGCLPPEDPGSYNRRAIEIAAADPSVFFPDQHRNRENSEAHYLSTGPEIWEQMEGRIDGFIAGIGTGGTISGVGRFLKERDSQIQVIGVDVEGSVFTDYFKTGSHGKPGHYLVEGLGDEEVIPVPQWELIDDIVQVSDREAFHAARRLARSEAILGGGSTGAALWAVEQVAERFDEGARLVTVFPDTGLRYLSTLYDDDWMRDKGLL